MDGPWNKSENNEYCMISHVEPKNKTKLIDTKNRSVVARGGGVGSGWNGLRESKGTDLQL